MAGSRRLIRNSAKVRYGLLSAVAVFAVCQFAPESASANVFYWRTTAATTAWATSTNWSTISPSDTTTSGPPSNSLTADIADFDSATSYTSQPTTLTGQKISGIIIGDGATTTAALTITTGTTTARLGIGGSGIVMNAGSGAVTIGAAATQGVFLGAAQTWENDSSSLLTVKSVANITSSATAFTLTLQGSGSGGISITNVIADSGTAGGTTALAVNMSGSGAVTLGGVNTFTGGVTVTAGTLNVSSDGNLGATTGTVTLNTGTLNSTASLTSARNFFLGSHDGNSGGGTIAVASAKSLTLSGTVADNNTGSATDSLTFSGASATSSLVLLGTNTCTGGTTITTGVLSFGTGGLGSTGSITFSGGTLQYVAAANTQDISSRIATSGANGVKIDVNNNAVTFAGAIGAGDTGGLALTSSTAGGSLIVTGSHSYSGSTTVGAGSTLQVGNGGAAGTLPGGSAITDTGALVYNLNNTFISGSPYSISNTMSGAGTFTVTGGAYFQLSGSNTLPTGLLTVSTNTTLDLNGGNQSVPGFTGAGTITSTASATATLTSTGTQTFAGVLTDGTAGGGGAGQALALKINGGTLTLTNNADNYTGGTTITTGTLQLGNGGATGMIAGAITDTTNLAYNLNNTFTAGSPYSIANAITGAGTLSLSGGAYFQLGGGASLPTGLLTVATGTTLDLNGINAKAAGFTGAGTITSSASGTATLTNTGTQTFAGLLTDGTGNGNGAGEVLTLASTGGTLTLTNGGNNFTGGTIISGGTTIFSTGALGSTGTIAIVGGGSSSTVVLKYASGNTDDLSSRLVNGASITGGAAGDMAHIDVNGNSVNYANPILLSALNGSGTGLVGINVSNDGGSVALLLTSSIPGGTLTLNGANTNTGNVQVESGATLVLGTTGTLTGSVFVKPGGGFAIINSANSNTTTRLGNGNATVNRAILTLAGATFTDTASSNQSPTDNMGVLDLGRQWGFYSSPQIAGLGYADTITVTPGAANSSPTLVFSALTRYGGATVNFQGTDGANNLTLGGSAGAPRVLFSTVPTLPGGILPWATVGAPGSTMTLATYDANGVRALTAAETSSTLNTPNSNIVLGSSDSTGGPLAINSLQINGNGTTLTNTGNTLTIASGGVLNTGSGNVISGGTLNFGGNEAVFQNVAGGAINVTSTLQNYRGLDAPEGVTFSGDLSIQGQSTLALGRTTSTTISRAANVISYGGAITYLTASNTTTVGDTFSGALHLAADSATDLSFNPGSTTSKPTLTFTQFTADPNSVLNVRSFAYNSNGSAAQTIGTASANTKVIFTSAPALIGGTLGTTSAGVLPNVLVAGGLATYDSNGLRGLAAAETTSTFSTGVNVSVGATASVASSVTVNSLQYTGSGTLAMGGNTVAITSGALIDTSKIGSAAGDGTIAMGSATGFIYDNGNNQVTLNPTLTGSNGMVFIMGAPGGNCILNLNSTSNSWTGGTTILANYPVGVGTGYGKLAITSDSILPNDGTGNAGGTQDANGFNIVLNGGMLEGNGAFTLAASRKIALGPVGGFGMGGFTTTTGVTFTVASTLSNNLNGTGALFVAYTGNNFGAVGTVALTGTNTYSGGTFVYAGTLAANVSSALGTGDVTVLPNLTNPTNSAAPPATLILGADKAMSQNGTLTVSGGIDNSYENATANITTSLSIGALAGGPSAGTSTVNVTGTPAAITLNIGRSDSSVSAYSGVIADAVNHVGNITKTGTSTQIFSGVNTYRGATTVTGGKLTIASTGTVNTSSGISINGGEFNYDSSTPITAPISFGASGGTLSGTGAINTPITGNGLAIISPGNSPGIQTYDAGLTFNSGDTYKWEHNAGNMEGTAGAATNGFDLIAINGGTGLSINPGAILSLNFDNTTDFTDPFWSTSESWVIASYTSGTPTSGAFASGNIFLSGTTSNLSGAGNTLSQGTFSTAIDGGNNLLLDWTPQATLVPEPASLAVLGLGVLGLLARRRRR